MLHYVLQTHGEPIGWRDLEALPFYVFGMFALFGIFQFVSMLNPVMQTMALQAIAIFGLTGLRRILVRDRGEDVASQRRAA